LKFNEGLMEKGIMKRRLSASLALIPFAGMLLIAAAPARAATKIMPGTVIPVELAKTLDAKKAKAGDKVEAKIVVDLLHDGEVVIPKGAKVTGHISDAKASSKDSKDSMVGIVFDQLSTKDGGELAIQTAIQAIGPPADIGSSSASIAGGPIGTSGASVPSGGQSRSPGRSLDSSSQGVIGMRGLSLSTSGPASVVSSSSGNVKLDGGTRILLRIQ
jgi:hypothetical protein